MAAYVTRVVAWVRDQFEYQKARTNVHSSVDDILKSGGGGVCQDFAHLTIGLLRLGGVPARYVSVIWLHGFRSPAMRRWASRRATPGSKHGYLIRDGPGSIRPIDIALMSATSGWPLDATMPTCRH